MALKEVFYTPPHSKIPIHTDHGAYTHHAKINITWGPEEGDTMVEVREDLSKEDYTGATSEFHDNLWAKEEDCDFLYEANTNKPSLVNIGMLHGTNNPTDRGRWTLCFVPQDQRGKFIHWNDALKFLRIIWRIK